jgi:tetratricopeptide (TPR) repeat protein
MNRILVVLAIAVTLSVSGGLGLVRGDGDRSATPTAVGAEGVAAMHGSSLTDVISGLQQHLRQLPGDAPSWATLALAYVEQARVTGDPTLYRQASQAVDRSLEEQPEDNAGALAAKAALSAAEHHFGTALADATQALAIDPYQPGALVVRVDALTELGRYGAQLRALRAADVRQPGEPVTTRYSYAFELRGRLARATSLLAGVSTSSAPADRAFALTQLADLERRMGRLDQAAAHLHDALRSSPDYVPALAGRARLAVARGRLQTAVTRWQQVVARLPLPEYLVELGELQLRLGHPKQARRQLAVVSTTTQLLSANGVNTDLESALFEADHGSAAAALTDARAEWGRRHSIHVADVLGWALHQLGRDHEALRYARLATRLGTPEARLWLHRGQIEAALGLVAQARAHLRRGLATDPGFSPWQVDRATAVLRHLGSAR